MNFEPVARNEKGELIMKFHKPFTIVERIQLLQRSILVDSFCYYELNENLKPDYMYDNNAKQLAELKKQYPDEFARSRYHRYFHDYCTDEDNAHYVSGFDLLEAIRKKDKELYRYIWMDAVNALEQKRKRGGV